MKRNGGVVIIFGVPIYLVFLTDENDHDMEYFKAFLTEVMEKNIEKFFTDDSFYKNKHPLDGFEIKLTKITPPISCYLSAEGCYEVEHGLFLQCKKSASVKTMDSFVTLKSKTKSDEKKENKKINKYLISSEDDSDQDITPPKKLKS